MTCSGGAPDTNRRDAQTDARASLSADASWETPQPEVKRRCRVCSTLEWPAGVLGVVSPSGIEHIGDGGETYCGRDATGPDWWWPL